MEIVLVIEKKPIQQIQNPKWCCGWEKRNKLWWKIVDSRSILETLRHFIKNSWDVLGFNLMSVNIDRLNRLTDSYVNQYFKGIIRQVVEKLEKFVYSVKLLWRLFVKFKITWENNSCASVNRRNWVDVFFRSASCLLRTLSAKFVVANKAQPELFPFWLSWWFSLRCSFHGWQMWMCAWLRSRSWTPCTVVSFVVNWTYHWIFSAVIYVQQSLRGVVVWNERVIQISSDLFNLFDIFPLAFVIRRWDFSRANFREVMNASKLK